MEKHTRHVFGFDLATPGYNVRPVLYDLFLATNHTMSSFGTRWLTVHMRATVESFSPKKENSDTSQCCREED